MSPDTPYTVFQTYDSQDKSAVLRAIALDQLECKDLDGALETTKKIQAGIARDLVLLSLFKRIIDVHPMPTQGTGYNPSLLTTTPAAGVATKAKGPQDSGRDMAKHAAEDAAKVIGAMTDTGITALAWGKLASLQTLELKETDAAKRSFEAALTAASALSDKPYTALPSPATSRLASVAPPGALPADKASQPAPASIPAPASLKDFYLTLILAALGSAAAVLVHSILKSFGEQIAKEVGEDKIVSKVGRWVAKAREKRRARDEQPRFVERVGRAALQSCAAGRDKGPN